MSRTVAFMVLSLSYLVQLAVIYIALLRVPNSLALRYRLSLLVFVGLVLAVYIRVS